MADVFYWIVSSSLIITVILLVRAALGHRMSPGLRYALWALVLLRLLVPFTVGESAMSVENLTRNVELPAPAAAAEELVTAAAGQGESASAPRTPADSFSLPAETAPEPEEPEEPEETVSTLPAAEPEEEAETLAVPAEEASGTETLAGRLAGPMTAEKALFLIWACGCAFLGLYFIAVNTAFAVRMHGRRKRLDIECLLPVYSVDNLSSSCLFGVLRPTLYIAAETAEDPEKRRHVLAHELAHFRHGDNLWSLLRSAMLALHWYNPLVWAAALMSRRDAELLADAGAIRALGEEERERYGITLIRLAARCPKSADILCTVATMNGGKRALRERVTMIARKPRMTVWLVLAVTVIAAVAAGCAFTGEKSVEAPASVPAPLTAEIANLIYTQSADTVRLGEDGSGLLLFSGRTWDYTGEYAAYHFDPAVSQESRNQCVAWTEAILTRMGADSVPDVYILSDYDSVWIRDGTLISGSAEFNTIDYAAQVIELALGGWANYGTVYGYANYLSRAAGWEYSVTGTAEGFAACPARDLNLLCFRAPFVSDEELDENKRIAAAFAEDCITAKGEGAYIELLRLSGDTGTVDAFNEVLSAWYREQGVDYAPSPVLYSFGGQFYDYRVKSSHANWLMARDWVDVYAEGTVTAAPFMDKSFLHGDYGEIKLFFELNDDQLTRIQETLALAYYDNEITVNFTPFSYNGVRDNYIDLGQKSIDAAFTAFVMDDITLIYLMENHGFSELDSFNVLEYGLTRYVLVGNDAYGGIARSIRYNQRCFLGEAYQGFAEFYFSRTEQELDYDRDYRQFCDAYAYYFGGTSNYSGPVSYFCWLVDQYGFETVRDAVTGRVSEKEAFGRGEDELKAEWMESLRESFES
ncbi:MAG: M56 family metallopeptidase [Oscillospiraceae bacterium]